MIQVTMMKQLLVWGCALAVSVAVAGCSDDDDNNPAGPGNGQQEQQFTMPSNIKEVGQFFDFSTGTVTNALTAYDGWNVAFENGQMAIGIALNFGTGGRAMNTGQTEFDAVTDVAEDAEFILDGPWGDPSSVAISGWYTMTNMGVIESKQEVYIIAATEGTEIVTYKFQMLGYADNAYSFKFSRLPDGETVTAQVTKGTTTHWMYYSFVSHAVVPFEPPKDSWDVYFGPLAVQMGTSYRAVGKILPNVASGVTVATAEDVELDDLTIANWSGNLEEVYMLPSWYEYNHDTSEYATFAQSTLLTSTEGVHVGLQFLSYQSAGTSGFPTFKYIYEME